MPDTLVTVAGTLAASRWLELLRGAVEAASSLEAAETGEAAPKPGRLGPHVAAILRDAGRPRILLSDGRVVHDGDGFGYLSSTHRAGLRLTGPGEVEVFGVGPTRTYALCEAIDIGVPPTWGRPDGDAREHLWAPFTTALGSADLIEVRIIPSEPLRPEEDVQATLHVGAAEQPLPFRVQALERVFVADVDADMEAELVLIGQWIWGHGPQAMVPFRQALVFEYEFPAGDIEGPSAPRPTIQWRIDERFRGAQTAWDVAAELPVAASGQPLAVEVPAH